MRENAFEQFLLADGISSSAAAKCRVIRGRKAEAILNRSLDTIVSDDDTMFEALQTLQNYDDAAHSPMQNALRKYYKFANGREFPKMRYYRKS